MFTKLIEVNNVGDPEPVVANSICHLITVRENPPANGVGWPTTDYRIRQPYKTSDAENVLAGESYRFERKSGHYFPGQVVGYIETETGTTTFSQRED